MPTNVWKTTAILAAAGTAVVAAFLLSVGADGTASTPPVPGVARAPSPPPAHAERPRIDVVFVLDTTSSMSALIDGAKRKIWTIANQIESGQPRPDVRIGLVGFRDRGDAYVTLPTGLTRDVDSIYQQLQTFAAEGGGDGPEDVNAALASALSLDWDQRDDVLKMIFLVGDAPPHDDYDGPKSWELAAQAAQRGIIVNTVRAGSSGETLMAWQRIAGAAQGQVTTIEQSGGMVAVATPYDAELERLNRALADNTIAYGAPTARRHMRAKIGARKAMKGEVAAAAAGFAGRSGAGLGRGDLLADLESGAVQMGELDPAKMPEPLAAMPADERTRVIEKTRAERAKIVQRIAELSKKRDAELRSSSAAAEDSFDAEVGAMLEKKAADIGVTYE